MQSANDYGKITQVGVTAGGGSHDGQPLYHLGTPLDEAQAVVVLLHGRGATAESILTLVPYLFQSGAAFLAPQAAQQTWYPYSFLAPRQQNEPFLTSALDTVGAVFESVLEQGFTRQQVVLGGFSQGACLASEYAGRHPQRYGGVVAFSGGLIGPESEPLDHSGDLAGTPIFLGCSDVDPHIPLTRVDETADVFSRMQAQVTKRIYPGMEHTVNAEELSLAQALISDLLTGGD